MHITHTFSVFSFRRQTIQHGLVDFLFRDTLFSDGFDVVERFRVLRCLENLIELRLQDLSGCQRPMRVFLVTENNIIQNCSGDPEKVWYLGVDLSALSGDGSPLRKL